MRLSDYIKLVDVEKTFYMEGGVEKNISEFPYSYEKYEIGTARYTNGYTYMTLYPIQIKISFDRFIDLCVELYKYMDSKRNFSVCYSEGRRAQIRFDPVFIGIDKLNYWVQHCFDKYEISVSYNKNKVSLIDIEDGKVKIS